MYWLFFSSNSCLKMTYFCSFQRTWIDSIVFLSKAHQRAQILAGFLFSLEKKKKGGKRKKNISKTKLRITALFWRVVGFFTSRFMSWCSLQGAAETQSLEVGRRRGMERSENWHRTQSLFPLDVQAGSRQSQSEPSVITVFKHFHGPCKVTPWPLTQGTSFHISAAGTSSTALVMAALQLVHLHFVSEDILEIGWIWVNDSPFLSGQGCT